MSFRFDRAYYRVTYPISARPILDWAGMAVPVLDVSEQGLRFVAQHGTTAEVGTPVKGILRFPSGKSAEVEGKVVRFYDGEAGVQLKSAIPYRLIIDEQLYLQQHFPTRR